MGVEYLPHVHHGWCDRRDLSCSLESKPVGSSMHLQTASDGHRGKVKAYYAAEGAFYTASVFMLLLWEERRKDFWAMLLHHVVTFALITASYSLS